MSILHQGSTEHRAQSASDIPFAMSSLSATQLVTIQDGLKT